MSTAWGTKAGANTGRSRRMALLSSTVLCLTLMFMPEILEQWRHSQHSRSVTSVGGMIPSDASVDCFDRKAEIVVEGLKDLLRSCDRIKVHF